MKEPRFSTRVIDTVFARPDAHGAITLPVYRNAAFEFPDSESIAAAFRGESGRHTYSRVSNPNVTNFEQKASAASGAESVVALSSGMAAITNTFFAIASVGSNIVSSPHLFGNTFSFFRSLAAFGVEVRFVDAGDVEQIAAAVDDRTCAFFAEVVTNPHMEVADLPAISKILRVRGVPMIVDTTIVPWCAFDARRAGIDVEIVSTTKYISGGATGTGGVIVDHGTADWSRNPRLAAVPEPSAGVSSLTAKLRGETVRNLGAVMTPDTAATHSLGLETLLVRFERMSASANALARRFEGHPKVARVGYPGLDSSPYKALSDSLFTGRPGAMFTLSLGSREACFRFMDALRVWRRATNLFDNKSLVIHPSSTIYCTFTPEMKLTAGIEDDLVRFSVGLEDAGDLAEDIENALRNA
ncbi:MAG: PLP-dependent transferase [Alistipes sp.]|nr:PLP-dependent transferase [Alistipes sp.]